MMRLVNNDWKTKQLMQIKKSHAYFGYFVALAVQLPMVTGFIRYWGIRKWNPHGTIKLGLICGNVAFWLAAIIVGEIYRWRRLNSTVLYKPVQQTMSRDEFEAAI